MKAIALIFAIARDAYSRRETIRSIRAWWLTLQLRQRTPSSLSIKRNIRADIRRGITQLFFYSRKRQKCYSLDDAIADLGGGNGCITGGLELRAPCTLITAGRTSHKNQVGFNVRPDPADKSGDPILTINLSWLENRLIESAVSSDAKDKNLKEKAIKAEDG